MKLRSINNIALTGLLAVLSITLTQCTQNKATDWQKTNDELIEKYSLSKKDISGLPKNTTESNLEVGKVKDTQTLDSTQKNRLFVLLSPENYPLMWIIHFFRTAMVSPRTKHNSSLKSFRNKN